MPAGGVARALIVEACEFEVPPAAAVADHDLLADDLEAASEVSTPSVTQLHALLADDVEAASEVSIPAVGQAHALLADDVESATEVSTPTAAHKHVLLADDLEPLRYRGPISSVHHLMAHCRLLVGESATMASAAALLGVPAISCGHDFPGDVRELEQAGLLRTVRPGETHRLPATIDAALASPVTAARDRYVAARPDWAGVVVTALDDVAGRCAGE